MIDPNIKQALHALAVHKIMRARAGTAFSELARAKLATREHRPGPIDIYRITEDGLRFEAKLREMENGE